MTVQRPPARPSEPQGNQCSIPHFLASLGEKKNWYCTNIAQKYCDQLTAVKTGYSLTSITWPYCGLGCRPVKLSADKLLVFKWSQAQVYFFLIHMKYVVFICSRITILNSNWPRMRKFMQLLQAGKTVAFDFSPRPRVGRALRPIFMLWLVKNWQVSSNLFTLTAEADIVLCHLVMFLTVFFHWMYKTKFSCYEESFGIYN